MIGIGCRFCAYCLDEALVLRLRLREQKEAEEQAKEDVIAQKRKAMGIGA